MQCPYCRKLFWGLLHKNLLKGSCQLNESSHLNLHCHQGKNTNVHHHNCNERHSAKLFPRSYTLHRKVSPTGSNDKCAMLESHATHQFGLIVQRDTSVIKLTVETALNFSSLLDHYPIFRSTDKCLLVGSHTTGFEYNNYKMYRRQPPHRRINTYCEPPPPG